MKWANTAFAWACQAPSSATARHRRVVIPDSDCIRGPGPQACVLILCGEGGDADTRVGRSSVECTAAHLGTYEGRAERRTVRGTWLYNKVHPTESEIHTLQHSLGPLYMMRTHETSQGVDSVESVRARSSLSCLLGRAPTTSGYRPGSHDSTPESTGPAPRCRIRARPRNGGG
jgi:hypothetical protein